jgi:hypothetical protein
LFDQAQLIAGQTVLIHGGAGNVGAYAVQLARRAGIRTIATAATDEIAFVRELGAHTVVDFQTERFEDAVRNVDAVLDLVGGETQNRSFKVLRRGGKLISAVSQSDQELAKSHGVDATFFLVNVTTRHLTELADLIDRGNLKTRVGAVLPLVDAREAHFILEGRRPPRKGSIHSARRRRRISRNRGNDLAAMDTYEQAINLARKNEYQNEEALANEVAAKFHLGRGTKGAAEAFRRLLQRQHPGRDVGLQPVDERVAEQPLFSRGDRAGRTGVGRVHRLPAPCRPGAHACPSSCGADRVGRVLR